MNIAMSGAVFLWGVKCRFLGVGFFGDLFLVVLFVFLFLFVFWIFLGGNMLGFGGFAKFKQSAPQPQAKAVLQFSAFLLVQDPQKKGQTRKGRRVIVISLKQLAM